MLGGASRRSEPGPGIGGHPEEVVNKAHLLAYLSFAWKTL